MSARHPTTTMWRVLRLDDNGNTYRVAELASEHEAHALAAVFEGRMHEQMYMVEHVPDVTPAGDAADAAK